jgi:hypothetical protein
MSKKNPKKQVTDVVSVACGQYAKEKLRVESEIGREKELSLSDSVVQAIFHCRHVSASRFLKLHCIQSSRVLVPAGTSKSTSRHPWRMLLMRTGGFALASSALTSSTLKWWHRIQCGFNLSYMPLIIFFQIDIPGIEFIIIKKLHEKEYLRPILNNTRQSFYNCNFLIEA